MPKYFILLFCLFFVQLTVGQEEEKDADVEGWQGQGTIAFLLNQSAFNADWQGGGTTNIAGSLNLSHDLNYKCNKLSWDTKFIGDYGRTKIKDQTFSRKTSDRLEINSILGSKIKETNWNYSAILNLRSQWSKGYKFFNREIRDEEGELVELVQDREEITRAFAPTYIQVGPGFLWKKSDNLKVNIAPATARIILVSKKFTRVDLNDEAAVAAYIPYFGVAANESFRFEMGASLSAYAKFPLMENISMENILSLYSDYIENPQNIDIDYTMNIALAVNKYITANLAFQSIYDDNATRGFQIREVIGLGFKSAL